MRVFERIKFSGHRNICATHKTTLEITKSTHLTHRGDCIIGVGADKACVDLDQTFKDALRRASSISFTLMVGGLVFSFSAEGSPNLILTHEEDVVIRRSEYVCPRTLAIRANVAAADIPREIVGVLKTANSVGFLLIEVEV
ncbi:MAG: DUF371 domain-containing protein [Nitrososphaerales archaeon]